MKFLFSFFLAFALMLLCSVDVQAGQTESKICKEKAACLTVVAVEKQVVFEMLTELECGFRSIACIHSFWNIEKPLALFYMEKRCIRISKGKYVASSISPNYLTNRAKYAIRCQPYRLQRHYMRC